MQLNDLAAYTSILVALTLAPGPMIAVTISRSLSKDVTGALAFILGVAAGDLLIIVMICGGLGTWLQSVPAMFAIAKFASLLYLLHIAYGLWFSSEREIACRGSHEPLVFSDVIAGMTTCVVSPQTTLIYLMLLPGLVDITNVSKAMIGFIASYTFVVITLSFTAVILLAYRLNTYRGSPHHKLFLNRILSLVICLSGIWIVST